MPIFRNGKIPLKFLDPRGDPDHDDQKTPNVEQRTSLYFFPRLRGKGRRGVSGKEILQSLTERNLRKRH